MPFCAKFIPVLAVLMIGCTQDDSTWPKTYNRKHWVELPIQFYYSEYVGFPVYDDSGKAIQLPAILKSREDLKKLNANRLFTNVDFEKSDVIFKSVYTGNYWRLVKIEPRYFINFDQKLYHLSSGMITEKTDRSVGKSYTITAIVPNIPDGFELDKTL